MKRKVILYISVSLDGFIADSNGKVDWLEGQEKSYDSDYGYSEFIKDIDTVILGHNTYKQIVEELSPNEWVYKDLISYVFTNEEIKSNEDINFINGDIALLIEDLKKQEGKNIWICGGANIANQLIKDNLIDEYHITTVPIILGNGIRLFQRNDVRIKLRLKEIKEENGMITSIYLKR